MKWLHEIREKAFDEMHRQREKTESILERRCANVRI